MAKKIDVNGLDHFKEKENAMIASEYSSSKTYAVGDYVYHNGTLYKCTTAITTAEAWTSGHWTAAKLADDCSGLMTALAVTNNYVFEDSEVVGSIVYISDIVQGAYLNSIESDGLSSSDDIYIVGKNMYTDGDISGVRYVEKNLSNPLPAGTYTMSVYATSEDTDSDTNVVSFLTSGGTNLGTLQFQRNARKNFTFTINNTCAKITFTGASAWSKAANDNFTFQNVQIELGSNLTDYEEAVELQITTKGSASQIISLSDKMTAYNLESESMTVNYKKANSARYTNNLLNGKKVYWDGDSIMYGAGYTGGFANIIAQRNNMDSTMYAVSGGTLAVTSSDHDIVTSIAAMDANADYYIFDGGVNDVELTVNRGEITTGYTATLDNTTFYGALESICKDLVTNKPGKKYGYVFIQRVYAADSEWETTLKPNMIKILNKWGIPYIDMSVEIPPLGLISSLASAYMDNGGTLHPNEDGYKKYFVDKIEAWMQTL